MRPKKEARILIVDDVASTTAAIREALIRNGFSSSNIQECHTLQGAKRILRRTKDKPEEKFDVITIDLYMGGDLWAGTELCDFLEREYRNGQTKSIIYTGVVYSRFTDPSSVYLEEGVAKDVTKKLEGYKTRDVISAILPKTGNHEELINAIESFYTNSQAPQEGLVQ